MRSTLKKVSVGERRFTTLSLEINATVIRPHLVPLGKVYRLSHRMFRHMHEVLKYRLFTKLNTQIESNS